MQSDRAKPNLQPVILLAIACLTTGCASPSAPWRYSSLPSRQEFKKPLPDLLAEYPDLSLCKPRVGRILCEWDSRRPPAEPLVQKWGKPDRSSFSLWSLTYPPPVLSLLFGHYASWYWKIEDKEVRALVLRALRMGYEPRVSTLEVRQAE